MSMAGITNINGLMNTARWSASVNADQLLPPVVVAIVDEEIRLTEKVVTHR